MHRFAELLNRLTHPGRDLTIAPSEYDPRAQQVRFFSHVLGTHKQLQLYLPPEAGHQQPVPALYLMRGHEREWVNPHEDATRGGRNVIDAYEKLRTAGQIGPLALIMPGLSSDDGTLSGLLTNFLAPQLAAGKAGIGNGHFEDYFIHELLPLVERLFPLDKQRRAVAGFSLGGAMAVKIAAQHPQLFCSASAYDGTFLYAGDDGLTVRADDGVLANPIFDPVFGVPRNLGYVAAQSPSNLILRGDGPQLRRLRWIIQYGPQASEPWGSNFYRGEHLLWALSRHGITNSLAESALADGDHTWRTADRHLMRALLLHNQALHQ